MVSPKATVDITFLSTPSARRATCWATAAWAPDSNFYPRPPRGGRRADFLQRRSAKLISIHALREEGDTFRLKIRTRPKYFYPRPPRGGRRGLQGGTAVGEGISIHALREEGDTSYRVRTTADVLFLSTPSARRATGSAGPKKGEPNIFLSTPSARRATTSPACSSVTPTYFYPRPPRGGRRTATPAEEARNIFLSTPSARRATTIEWAKNLGIYQISIHALREEGDAEARPDD